MTLDINERVKLINLFSAEMGDKVRAKKHLTIGYTLDLLHDFVQRAYEVGKLEVAQQGQQATQVREAALEEAALAAEACVSAANNNFIWEVAQRNIAEDIRLLKGKPVAGPESGGQN